MNKKPILFSGIQPTGNLHIGNYLGAIRNWATLQNEGKYQPIFSIVDYHSLTGNRTAEERRAQITKTAAELLALGIDPEKAVFFVQSHVPAHTELAWIFNTVTPIAELERMTQFKDKSQQQAQNINTGLLTYPVLQAADILLYQAAHVPVGKDQIQHIELTRDIARWFNHAYGEYFVETNAVLTENPRIKSLLEPTKKMSKSKGAGHVIELCDSPEQVKKKIKKSVTATAGGGDNPGVNNLLLLLKEFGSIALSQEYSAAEKDGSIRYGDLKEDVSQAISTYFAEFRNKRAELLSDHDAIASILIDGAHKAQKMADATITDVRKLIGVR